MGSKMTQQWSPDLDNAANKKFVSDFLKKHGRYPSFYGAQAYDSIMLIKSAVDAVDSNMDDKDASSNHPAYERHAAWAAAVLAGIRAYFNIRHHGLH